ncbi:MAG: hypothetical protein QW076_06395 [Candidatus Anstonellales archaeon]
MIEKIKELSKSGLSKQEIRSVIKEMDDESYSEEIEALIKEFAD